MASKGNSVKRDFIKSTDSKNTKEVDTLSTVDMGKDFVKSGETVTVVVSHGYKQVNN